MKRAGEHRGMSPAMHRSRGEVEPIRFAVARTDLGWVLVAGTVRGLCAIDIGDSREGPDRRPQGPVRQGRVFRGRSGIRPLAPPGDGVDRVSAARPGPSPGHPRHGLPAEGLAGASPDPRRRDGELRGGRPPDREARLGPRRGPGMRIESPPPGRSLSQGGPKRWGAGRLPRWGRTKARVAREGGPIAFDEPRKGICINRRRSTPPGVVP